MSAENEVSISDLPFEKWWTAKRAAAIAADLCCIDPPRIRWFSAPRTLLGKVKGRTPRTIWLRADLAGEELVRTVAHECRHALHFEEGALPIFPALAPEEIKTRAEADATAFEDDVLEAYCRAYGTP